MFYLKLSIKKNLIFINLYINLKTLKSFLIKLIVYKKIKLANQPKRKLTSLNKFTRVEKN